MKKKLILIPDRNLGSSSEQKSCQTRRRTKAGCRPSRPTTKFGAIYAAGNPRFLLGISMRILLPLLLILALVLAGCAPAVGPDPGGNEEYHFETFRPTDTPEITAEPTTEPEPTTAPTPAPTPEPTPQPAQEPTSEPTPEPTAAPTSEPTPEPTPTLPEDGSYTTKEDVALYLHLYGHLPDNFITKKEAQDLGWSGGSLEKYAPGKCIGGDRFGNYEGLLPKGKKYTECDIDTLGAKSRGAKRIVFSDDGCIYYTDDHYESFTLLYGEE